MINPDVRKKVQSAMKEIDVAMNEIDAQKEQIKDIINKLADEHEELDKKVLRKLGRIYHKQNLGQVKLDNDTLVDFYDEVFNSATKANVTELTPRTKSA